ncbi:MAG: Crp/Fnr family transcriptional regulator [Chthoniobacterales bacterium]
MKQIDFDHQVEAAISGHPILSLLPDRSRRQFVLEAALFRIEKGEALYQAGEPTDFGWAIVSGQFKIVKRSRKKKDFVVEIVVPGELCGAPCIGRKPRLVFDAFAAEESVALRFPIVLLEAVAATDLRVAQALLRDCCRRLYHAEHMRSLLGEDVAGRVACALVYLQAKFGDEIPQTRRTLAQLAGTTVESAIRATRRLSEEGILETGRHQIRILKAGELKNVAHPTR